MKTKSLAFALLLLGFAFIAADLAALAQTNPPASNAGSTVADSNIRGCLQPGKDHVTLTDATGTTYLLKGNVGQTTNRREFVQISGQQVAPTGAHGEAALPIIQVKNLKKLADQCPVNLTPPPARTRVYNPTSPQQSPTTPPYDRPATAPAEEGAPVINTPGAGGAPSPGTGNPPPPQQR